MSRARPRRPEPRPARGGGPGRGAPPSRAPREVVVIGAGAVGAACAAALARAGLPVRVLTLPGRSTTGVSGGHLLLQTKIPGPRLDLARRSLELLAELAAGREAELYYRSSGSLLLAAGDDEAAALRTHYESLAAAGVPLEWLDGAAARELEPALAPGITAATHCPLDAQIHPGLLAGAWLTEAIGAGAVVVSGAEVQGFVTHAGAVCGVVASGVEYPAASVVLAAGPWSGDLASMAGVETGIRPRRGLLLRGQVPAPVTSRPLVGADYLAVKYGAAPAAVAFSLQHHPDGELVLGGTREFAEWEAGVPDDLVDAVVRCGARYVPALADVAWETRTVGFRPWTPERLPPIGEGGLPGLFLACGHEGDGITLAAATAERIADAVRSRLTA